MIKILSFRNLFLLFFLSIISISGSAFNETTAKLMFTVDGVEISVGEIVNGEKDFSRAKFQITDYLGTPLDQFEIVEGHLLPEASRSSVRGTILSDGTLDARSLEFLAQKQAQKMVFNITTIHKTNNSVMKWHFNFYRWVKPEVSFGSVFQGGSPTLDEVVNESKIQMKVKDSHVNARFKVLSGTLSVDGEKGRGKILPNGELDAVAKDVLQRSAGKQVTIVASYRNPDRTERKSALVFTVKE